MAVLQSDYNHKIKTRHIMITTHTLQPLLMAAFSCILLTPLASTLLLVFSRWKHLQFKIMLQRYLHASLIFMLILAWFIELYLPTRAANSIELLLTLCALAMQMALVVYAFLKVNKQKKQHHRAKNFL